MKRIYDYLLLYYKSILFVDPFFCFRFCFHFISILFRSIAFQFTVNSINYYLFFFSCSSVSFLFSTSLRFLHFFLRFLNLCFIVFVVNCHVYCRFNLWSYRYRYVNLWTALQMNWQNGFFHSQCYVLFYRRQNTTQPCKKCSQTKKKAPRTIIKINYYHWQQIGLTHSHLFWNCAIDCGKDTFS